MRRLIILLLLLVLTVTACTFGFQTMTQAGTETPSPTSAPTTEAGIPETTQVLEGPDINYHGIRFTLDPALGSRLYIFNDILTIDGKTAHSFRFSPASEQYCMTWCVTIYPVAEFQQAFGDFIFPPAGYRGGAAVVFKAQEKPLSFQNGTGTRALETFGQDHYGVSNESLKYVFRGYSADKQYSVYVQVPIRTAFLPDMAPTMPTSSDPIQDILQYNQEATQSINALVPADFTPSLDSLDALVASIRTGNTYNDPPVAPTIPITTSIPSTANDTAEEPEIRELVENFGTRLQAVSLQSPDAAQELQEQYSEFVSPALLEIWLNDVSKAPGRMVSSPWPDRIEITALSREGSDRYEITGLIVEVTSTEVGSAEAAAKIPIRIVVQREPGGWLITEYTQEQ